MEIFSKEIEIITHITITEEEKNFLNKLYHAILDIRDENNEVVLEEVIEDLIKNKNYNICN